MGPFEPEFKEISSKDHVLDIHWESLQHLAQGYLSTGVPPSRTDVDIRDKNSAAACLPILPRLPDPGRSPLRSTHTIDTIAFLTLPDIG